MARTRSYDRDTALDAAMHLFWRKGFHATSLKDLEQELSMKPGSIYAAFESKEALYALSMERYFERSRANLRHALAGPSPLQGLADFLRATARLRPEDPGHCACMLVKTVLNTTDETQAMSAQARDYLDRICAEMAAGIERAKQLGEISQRADPERLAKRFQANVTQLRIEAHRGLDQPELDALAEDMAKEIEALRLT
jgi:TetR/AcrR family transcriptional repressor of nem operon